MIDYKTTPISQMSIYEDLIARYIAALLIENSNVQTKSSRDVLLKHAVNMADETIKLFNQNH